MVHTYINLSFLKKLKISCIKRVLSIYFRRDLRNPSSVYAEFIESHNDDITQAKFHPISPTQLITGSVDGLICNFNLNSFKEDKDLVGVINSGSSINRAGYFGNAEYVYCLTHNETFSLWGAPEVCSMFHEYNNEIFFIVSAFSLNLR